MPPTVPPKDWPNDRLLSRAEGLAAEGCGESAAVLYELARRYRIAVENERKRYLSAAETFGVRGPLDREQIRPVV